ncbi:DarT1-associated NADAR antitoxin family protein [Bacillus cereus]|uniref:DarT1-associated NADAR antitoxin family protein n=1 Tax=Bacillus cereus TaxID=1396 RepID=UPI0013E8E145|nr:hypothetical protein [Bacillus cereus]
MSNPYKNNCIDEVNVNFKYYCGFSVAQKRKSINAMHESFLSENRLESVLEVSSKSESDLGRALSAFNLKIELKNGKNFSVENAFQASKVFEFGGPFLDLLYCTAKEAKKDVRLKNSGNLISFRYFNREWPLCPKTAFYDWLYINALARQQKLGSCVLEYSAFSDIEFNPKKSINCQARALALYVSLHKADKLQYVLSSVDQYMEVLGEGKKIKMTDSESEEKVNEKDTDINDGQIQMTLFDKNF